jgi:hypothetical protein
MNTERHRREIWLEVGDLINCHNEPALVTDIPQHCSNSVEIMFLNGYRKLISRMSVEMISESR